MSDKTAKTDSLYQLSRRSADCLYPISPETQEAKFKPKKGAFSSKSRDHGYFHSMTPLRTIKLSFCLSDGSI